MTTLDYQIQNIIDENVNERKPTLEAVDSIRKLLASHIISMCQHEVTESVACDACFYAALVTRGSNQK